MCEMAETKIRPEPPPREISFFFFLLAHAAEPCDSFTLDDPFTVAVCGSFPAVHYTRYVMKRQKSLICRVSTNALPGEEGVCMCLGKRSENTRFFLSPRIRPAGFGPSPVRMCNIMIWILCPAIPPHAEEG
ncbi:hypothetical protein LY78DRAFT_107918 [Colletotrichum sublineola]|nr:hypothetical protein LY78DRAFT_107918 [Colletotrichum sublineola]